MGQHGIRLVVQFLAIYKNTSIGCKNARLGMASVSDTLIGGKLIGYSNTFEVRDSPVFKSILLKDEDQMTVTTIKMGSDIACLEE